MVVKYAACLLVLVACGSQSAPEVIAPAPAAMAACPACPACPTADCPTLDCAACPRPAPVPAPIVGDWHCTEVVQSGKAVVGHCYSIASVCERKHESIKAKNVGEVTPCTARRTAYCSEATLARTMGRRLMCSRTLEHCELRRKDILENEPVVNDATPCESRFNTDTFERRRPTPNKP